ncbi:MAG: NUDIX domain-containing protein [Chloroflexi bacterium]|nr:NUDIX domain-containing protein [Chloroflexota bacterium]
MIEKRKAFAYITHQNRLLVFEHADYPDAGIQVPAGSIEPDETPEQGVMREAFEETGLEGLVMAEFLGMVEYHYNDQEIAHRYFFHLTCDHAPPETWSHMETNRSDGNPEPLEFRFYWATLPDGVPKLVADHDILVGELSRRLGL